MAGRRPRSYTMEEVARTVMDVPDYSDVSDFEGKGEDGDAASDMFESSSDSGDSDNSARTIEHEDNSLDQSSDNEGEAGRNKTTTFPRGRSGGRRQGRAHGTTRRARSRSPINLGKCRNLDEVVAVSFPDFRGQLFK